MEAILIVIGIFAALVVIAIVINNGIIRRKNMVVRAWADVITYERQKNETLPALEEQAKEYKEHEGTLLADIAALRSAIDRASAGKVDTADLAKIEAATSKLMSGFHIAVEAYPDLKMANVTLSLMKEISELQENVAAAISIFNANVEAFNSGIQIFPNSLVNSYGARQTAYRPFTNEAALSSLGYSPSQE